MSREPARERLLRATAELVYAGGIDATGVDAIAARAGVTKRTLYQHFRSKNELVGAALAHTDGAAVASLRAAVRRRVDRGESPVEALFRYVQRLAAAPGFLGCAFLNAGLEMRERDHPVRPAVRSHTDARRELVTELARAEGIEQDAAVDALVLILEGVFALSAGRADPAVAEHGLTAALGVLASARRPDQPRG